MRQRRSIIATLACLGLVGCVEGAPYDIGRAQEAQTICPHGTTLSGVDVSHYQGTITWTSAADGGVIPSPEPMLNQAGG